MATILLKGGELNTMSIRHVLDIQNMEGHGLPLCHARGEEVTITIKPLT